MRWGKFCLLLALPFELCALVPPPLDLIDQQLRANVRCLISDPQSKPSRAWLFYWKAKYTKSEDERIRILEGALILAGRERIRRPRDPGPLYEWIAAKGELAGLKNKLVALTYIKPLETAALELKKIDPAYAGHGADRVLGYLYDKAPSFISIGSSKKAKEHYLLAIAGAPDYPANKLSYAEFLLEERDKIGAAYRAKEAITPSLLSRFPIEGAEWERQGNEILAKAEELSGAK